VKKQNPDGTVAVDGLNLDVPDGKTMILVGRGDCGKTARCARSAGWSSRPKAGST
jgi:ABC-type sugar transport system ATPase subunit